MNSSVWAIFSNEEKKSISQQPLMVVFATLCEQKKYN
jgi:hypothetical protein